MRYKEIAKEPKTYVVVFETGDELATGSKQLASELKLASSSFKAIGALSSVKLGWFNWKSKKYDTSVTLEEQTELVSLIGDIALKHGQPQVHAHVVVAKSDGSAHGGHLQEAYVRPTCELVLTEKVYHLQKQVDPESGLDLIGL